MDKVQKEENSVSTILAVSMRTLLREPFNCCPTTDSFSVLVSVHKRVAYPMP